MVMALRDEPFGDAIQLAVRNGILIDVIKPIRHDPEFNAQFSDAALAKTVPDN